MWYIYIVLAKSFITYISHSYSPKRWASSMVITHLPGMCSTAKKWSLCYKYNAAIHNIHTKKWQDANVAMSISWFHLRVLPSTKSLVESPTVDPNSIPVTPGAGLFLFCGLCGTENGEKTQMCRCFFVWEGCGASWEIGWNMWNIWILTLKEKLKIEI